MLVQDLHPGSPDSNPANLTNVNGTLFFTADDGVHSTELWKLAAASVPMAGDLNGDGQRTAADIPVMLTALSDLNTYQATNHLSGADLLTIADLDHDGHVTNADLQVLLTSLKSGGGGAVGRDIAAEGDGAAPSLISLVGYQANDLYTVQPAIGAAPNRVKPSDHELISLHHLVQMDRALLAQRTSSHATAKFAPPSENRMPSEPSDEAAALMLHLGQPVGLALTAPSDRLPPWQFNEGFEAQKRLLPGTVDQAMLRAGTYRTRHLFWSRHATTDEANSDDTIAVVMLNELLTQGHWTSPQQVGAS